MQQYTYDIVIEEDGIDPGFTVRVPALPGCYSQGDTIEEATANIREAIQGYLESLVKHGDPIPDNARVILTTPVTVELAA